MNPVRDLDVMVPYLRADMTVAGASRSGVMERFIGILSSEREAARKQMLEGLESDRYLAMLQTLEGATVSLVVARRRTTLSPVRPAVPQDAQSGQKPRVPARGRGPAPDSPSGKEGQVHG